MKPPNQSIPTDNRIHGIDHFELTGVPPNWLNVSLHWAALYRRKQEWMRRTQASASLARGRRERATLGDHATVIITLHRMKLLDKDGAEASVKPIIDGLKTKMRVKVGKQMAEVLGPGLIYDDDNRHCEWWVNQVRVRKGIDQKTVVEVRRDE